MPETETHPLGKSPEIKDALRFKYCGGGIAAVLASERDRASRP